MGLRKPKPSKVDPNKKLAGKKYKYQKVVCPTCRGSGEYHFRKCGLCKGSGKILVLP